MDVLCAISEVFCVRIGFFGALPAVVMSKYLANRRTTWILSSIAPVEVTWDGFSTNTHQEMTHQSTQGSETIHKSPTHLLWSLGARAGAIRDNRSE